MWGGIDIGRLCDAPGRGATALCEDHDGIAREAQEEESFAPDCGWGAWVIHCSRAAASAAVMIVRGISRMSFSLCPCPITYVVVLLNAR